MLAFCGLSQAWQWCCLTTAALEAVKVCHGIGCPPGGTCRTGRLWSDMCRWGWLGPLFL